MKPTPEKPGSEFNTLFKAGDVIAEKLWQTGDAIAGFAD
jgi:hypothetical protein